MRWRVLAEIAALDLRHAIRRMAKRPAFAVVASLSLALGIGANTAAFCVVYAVMLRPLPVQDPSTLAVVAMRFTGFQYSMSYAAYAYVRDHSPLAGVVAFRAQSMNVTSGDAAERVTGMLVSGNYFEVLGVGMTLGSPIQPSDDVTLRSGGARGPVAVLAHDFWVRRFGRDPGIVGRTIRVNGQSLTIAGVAASGFRGTRVGSMPDVFVPMMFAAQLFDDRFLTNPRNNVLRLIVRLRPGEELSQASAALTVAFRQFNDDVILPLLTTEAARNRARMAQIALEPGSSGLLEMGPTVRPTLYALMGLVALVLLLACVNVTNLLIARAERHHRDTAIAIALGAGRARLWTPHLTESLLISGAGLVLGLVFAAWMRGLLVQLVPAGQNVEIVMDSTVFAGSALVGVAVALALGVVTAWQSSRVGVIRALKGEDLPSRLWLRKGLIVGQFALSIVVLMAAALFTETLGRLRLVDTGFEREQMLIASMSPAGYSRDREIAFYTRVMETVRGIPGVTSAALAAHEPLDVNTGWGLTVARDGSGPRQASASVAFISPGYFATMGIPFVRGADFEARDDTAPLRRIIVNENFVRNYVPRGDPIGQVVVGNGNMEFEIIGVVRDSASIGLRDLDQQMMYVPGGRGVLHVRAAVPPATLVSTIEAAVRRIDPDVPVFNVRTMEMHLDRFLGRERTFAWLSSTFGALALVLSAIGLYGVMTHAVARRTNEMGIRLALGAGAARIVRLVMKDAVLLVAMGVGFGLPSAYFVARAMGTMLYGVEAGDWKSAVIAVIVLTGVAVGAAWVPARRAARVDPMVALRGN